MSWIVEGRSYHSYEEYQRAQAESQRARAVRAAQQLAAANRQLQQEIRADRARLEEVRDSVEQQLAISNRIQTNMQALERNQSRLQNVIEQTERRMHESLATLEQEITRQGGKLHAVEVDVGTVRQRHEAHVAQTRRDLSDIRTRMEQELAEAEQQRRLAEERVNAAIDAVDQKLERDRRERARTATDTFALAHAEVAAATATLERVDRMMQPLDLGGRLQAVAAEIAAARLLIAQGNAAAALATCTLARSSAESLEHEARTRQADMDAAREDVDRRIAWINQGVETAASPDVRACYRVETQMVRATIDASRARLAERYRNYRLLEVERREDGELLERLEEQVLEMSASAPGVAEAARKRARQLEGVVELLETVYGEAGDVAQRFASTDDPKSDLIADLTFGSSSVRLRLSLDGAMVLDGHGHGTNRDCAAAAQRVIQALQHRTVVEAAVTDNAGPPRTGPLETVRKGAQ